MRIKTGSGNFQPCPEYNGSAVCVDVTPLKTVQTQFGPKEKFRFVFETGQTKDDGTPWCVWSAPFTPSYHENSALRPFLRKWMGRELTAEETKTFDTEDMLGRTGAHHGDPRAQRRRGLREHRVDPAGQVGGAAEAVGQVRPDEGPPGRQDGKRLSPRGTGGGGNGDLGATKIHVGKCKGLEVRDLSPEQVGALIGNWLPTAKANAKPTADDRRLIAALEAWQAAQAATATKEDEDNLNY